MSTLSVSVSDDLRKKMSVLDDINWSAVARAAFEDKIKQVEFLKKITANSRLSQSDADKISEKINKQMAKRFRSM